MKKGISIPINTMVMLAIAIIVLLAIVAWYMMSFTSSTQTLTRAELFKSCCSSYVLAGCTATPSEFLCRVTPEEKAQAGDENLEKSLQERAGAANIYPLEDNNIRRACGCLMTGE